jgi:hypothetical protein
MGIDAIKKSRKITDQKKKRKKECLLGVGLGETKDK